MGSGINVNVARYLGCQSDRDVSETVHTSAILCVIIGTIALLIGVLGARPMMQLLGTKDELIDGAIQYLQIYFLGMPALAVYNFGNAVLSAAGDTRRPLIIMIVAGIVNVILNLFFVIVCQLSVAGVAIASTVSQYLSAALIVRLLMRTKDSYALHLNQIRITPIKARSVLTLSLPAGMQNAIFAIANLFIQAGVNSFPAVVVEGNSAAANADALVYDVMAAFYTACSSFMSQNFGAGNRRRVIRSYYISLAYSFGIGAVLGGILLLFGDKFLMLFTTDPEVVQMGMDRLWVMCFSYAFSAFMDCTIAASRGIGKRRGAHGHRNNGLVRVPRDMGVYRVRVLPYDNVAVPAVHILMEHYRDCRNHLLPLQLSSEDRRTAARGRADRGLNLNQMKTRVCTLT